MEELTNKILAIVAMSLPLGLILPPCLQWLTQRYETDAEKKRVAFFACGAVALGLCAGNGVFEPMVEAVRAGKESGQVLAGVWSAILQSGTAVGTITIVTGAIYDKFWKDTLKEHAAKKAQRLASKTWEPDAPPSNPKRTSVADVLAATAGIARDGAPSNHEPNSLQRNKERALSAQEMIEWINAEDEEEEARELDEVRTTLTIEGVPESAAQLGKVGDSWGDVDDEQLLNQIRQGDNGLDSPHLMKKWIQGKPYPMDRERSDS